MIHCFIYLKKKYLYENSNNKDKLAYIKQINETFINKNVSRITLVTWPTLYHKEILYLSGFVISVSNISLCVTVDQTLIIEFDYRKTVLNIVMD